MKERKFGLHPAKYCIPNQRSCYESSYERVKEFYFWDRNKSGVCLACVGFAISFRDAIGSTTSSAAEWENWEHFFAANPSFSVPVPNAKILHVPLMSSEFENGQYISGNAVFVNKFELPFEIRNRTYITYSCPTRPLFFSAMLLENNCFSFMTCSWQIDRTEGGWQRERNKRKKCLNLRERSLCTRVLLYLWLYSLSCKIK